jgi:hypothetical protein
MEMKSFTLDLRVLTYLPACDAADGEEFTRWWAVGA